MFIIRDIMWLMVVIALICSWRMDLKRCNERYEKAPIVRRSDDPYFKGKSIWTGEVDPNNER